MATLNIFLSIALHFYAVVEQWCVSYRPSHVLGAMSEVLYKSIGSATKFLINSISFSLVNGFLICSHWSSVPKPHEEAVIWRQHSTDQHLVLEYELGSSAVLHGLSFRTL